MTPDWLGFDGSRTHDTTAFVAVSRSAPDWAGFRREMEELYELSRSQRSGRWLVVDEMPGYWAARLDRAIYHARPDRRLRRVLSEITGRLTLAWDALRGRDCEADAE
jgi:hypothetical protein